MEHVKQALIILLISTIGEALNFLIPLPIPGSIYGMVLLFILLCLGIVKIEHVKRVGKILLDIMPLLFIPSAVGIISEIDQIKELWLQVIITTIVTTIITMGVTGLTTQAMIRHKRRKEADNDDLSE